MENGSVSWQNKSCDGMLFVVLQVEKYELLYPSPDYGVFVPKLKHGILDIFKTLTKLIVLENLYRASFTTAHAIQVADSIL